MRVKNRTRYFPFEEISQILLCFLVSLLTSNTIQFPRCEKNVRICSPCSVNAHFLRLILRLWEQTLHSSKKSITRKMYYLCKSLYCDPCTVVLKKEKRHCDLMHHLKCPLLISCGTGCLTTGGRAAGSYRTGYRCGPRLSSPTWPALLSGRFPALPSMLCPVSQLIPPQVITYCQITSEFLATSPPPLSLPRPVCFQTASPGWIKGTNAASQCLEHMMSS